MLCSYSPVWWRKTLLSDNMRAVDQTQRRPPSSPTMRSFWPLWVLKVKGCLSLEVVVAVEVTVATVVETILMMTMMRGRMGCGHRSNQNSDSGSDETCFGISVAVDPKCY